MQKDIIHRLEKLESELNHKPTAFYFILPDGSKVPAEDDYDPFDIIARVKIPPTFPVDYLYTGFDELDAISKAFMGTVIEMGKEARNSPTTE